MESVGLSPSICLDLFTMDPHRLPKSGIEIRPITSPLGDNMTGTTIWKRRGDALIPKRERNRILYCNKGLHVVPSAILHGVVVVQTNEDGATPPSDQ